jgi:hypothetical protein
VSAAVKAAFWGAILALALVGVFLYALWPTLREGIVADLKGEIKAQNVIGGAAGDFLRGLVDTFK